uniref:Uncharacterized protein n=1 Tax=viral metagenome TaxID=1070528 RepID=A0A6M3XYJ8_9ZZZZ
MESWLLAQYSEIEAIKAEIQGMVALNQYRLSRDETIAYDDNAFQEKADALHSISTCIMQNR